MGQGLRASQVKKSTNAIGALQLLQKAAAKPAASIFKRVRFFELRLKNDCQCGVVIPKPYPKALVDRYGFDNLYKVELPDFWRLLYTIVRDGKTRYVVILEIVDHNAYNKWFPSDH